MGMASRGGAFNGTNPNTNTPPAGVAPAAPNINEAWNKVRAEARALAGIGQGFSALLAAVEEYGTACVHDALSRTEAK